MFFVSRLKHDELLSRYETMRLECKATKQQLQQAEDDLLAAQDLADKLLQKKTMLQADNEALLRFAAAAKANLDKLASELAENDAQSQGLPPGTVYPGQVS